MLHPHQLQQTSPRISLQTHPPRAAQRHLRSRPSSRVSYVVKGFIPSKATPWREDLIPLQWSFPLPQKPVKTPTTPDFIKLEEKEMVEDWMSGGNSPLLVIRSLLNPIPSIQQWTWFHHSRNRFIGVFIPQHSTPLQCQPLPLPREAIQLAQGDS